MNTLRLLLATVFLLAASSAEGAKVLRLGIGTDLFAAGSVLVDDSEGLMPWGAALVVDIQRSHSRVAIAPFLESYRDGDESMSYLGVNALLTGDVTAPGIYGGLGGGVARLRSWETSYYSPTIDLVFGWRGRLSDDARVVGEGKFMINTASDDTYSEDGGSEFGSEILLTLGIAVTL